MHKHQPSYILSASTDCLLHQIAFAAALSNVSNGNKDMGVLYLASSMYIIFSDTEFKLFFFFNSSTQLGCKDIIP